MPDLIAPVPGCDYRLRDGRVVRFVSYVFNVEYSGWSCCPHGTRRFERILVTDRRDFESAVEPRYA